MFFALFVLAASLIGTVAIGYFTNIWDGLAFATILYGVYKAATHNMGPSRPLRKSALNAFQQSLADDDDEAA